MRALGMRKSPATGWTHHWRYMRLPASRMLALLLRRRIVDQVAELHVLVQHLVNIVGKLA